VRNLLASISSRCQNGLTITSKPLWPHHRFREVLVHHRRQQDLAGGHRGQDSHRVAPIKARQITIRKHHRGGGYPQPRLSRYEL
jgi:hypothetical protein